LGWQENLGVGARDKPLPLSHWKQRKRNLLVAALPGLTHEICPPLQVSDFGFTYNFDLARVAVQNRFGRRRLITDYVPGVGLDEDFTRPSQDCKDVIDHLYKNGYRLVMAPSLFTFCLRWAHDAYTDLHLLLVGGFLSDANKFPRMSTGIIRDWESRYLSGVLAGAATKTNKIGYVAPFTFPICTFLFLKHRFASKLSYRAQI
jgi:hypothetical protein